MSEHSCGCCGCQSSQGGCCHQKAEPILLQPEQKSFLLELALQKELPVARFLILSSQEEDFCVAALAPVFIQSAQDSMETVKTFGAFLKEMESQGLLVLEYGTKMQEYAYLEYKNSDLYAFFCETVQEGAKIQQFLGDIPYLELGHIVLTDLGQRSLAIS